MMFREKSISKFYTFALAAVFALTLAGCGGSGGGSAMMDMDEEMPPVVVEPVDPEPTPEEIAAQEAAEQAEIAAQEEADALMAAQEGAMAAYMAAMAAAAGAVDPVAYAAAHEAAVGAKTASDAAAMAETSAMAMEYQTAAETARDSAVEAGMTRGLGITKLANATANKSAIDSAALVGTPAPPAISNTGRVGRAMRAAARLSDGGPAFIAEDTDVLATTNHGGTVSVTARHTGSSPRFTVMATTDDARALVRGEAPTSLMMRGGWEGAELVRTSGATGTNSKEYALAFTDIKAPAQSYDSTTPITAAALADVTTGATQSINRAVVTGEIPADGGHFAGTYNINPTDNAPPRSGRFFCPSGTPCSISVGASGVLRAIQGYTFQPVVPGSTDRQDSDYLAWGVWLHVPNGLQEGRAGTDGLTNTASVAAFASGKNVFEVQAALTGTATYNGVATGLYSAAGMVEYFDADVTLTADFGGRTANDSNTNDATENDMRLLGAVNGTVSNIKAGGMDVDGSLTLGKAKVSAPMAGDPAISFAGRTDGILGSRGVGGRWGGQFYGPNKAPAGSVAVRTEFPTTAAGTFGAGTIGGIPGAVSILGAFGTWKAE